jgi:hypothetical protein
MANLSIADTHGARRSADVGATGYTTTVNSAPPSLESGRRHQGSNAKNNCAPALCRANQAAEWVIGKKR